MGIMKSKFGMLAAMSMMMSGMGMPQMREPERYKRNKPKEHKPLDSGIKEGIVPKGHKFEYIKFQFDWQNNILEIDRPITYGTLKSRDKNIKSTQGELIEYIRETPFDKIKEFGQFKITEKL